MVKSVEYNNPAKVVAADEHTIVEEFVPQKIVVPLETFHAVMCVVNHVLTGYIYSIALPISSLFIAGYYDWTMPFLFFNPFLLAIVYVGAVMKIGICMSACLHRFFAHTAFKTGRVTSVFLGILACFGGQRGPLWWASKHVRHHKHCDNDLDPHSPQRTHKAYAFLFWVGATKEVFCDYEFLPKVFLTPELIIVDSFASAFPWIEHYLAYCLFGWTGFYMSMWSTIGCLYGTLAFNVIFHWVHEDEEVETFPDGTYKCAANDRVPEMFRNVLGYSGEYAHEDHHVHPNRAKRPTHLVDVPYWAFIKPLHTLGLFSQLNMGEGIKIE